jgi:8-oxo-dGTP diphosphatase
VMHRRHRMPDGYLFPQIDLYYWAEEWEGTVTNCEPHKCDELRFYPLEALPTTIEPFIPHALKCIQANEPFSEFGWY